MKKARIFLELFFLNRKRVKNYFMNLASDDMRLVQVFTVDQPASSIPVDQFVITKTNNTQSLALKPGKYWARIIDRSGTILSQKSIRVK